MASRSCMRRLLARALGHVEAGGCQHEEPTRGQGENQGCRHSWRVRCDFWLRRITSSGWQSCKTVCGCWCEDDVPHGDGFERCCHLCGYWCEVLTLLAGYVDADNFTFD